MKTWIISICLVLILLISFVFIKPLTYSSKNKVTVSMCGQSTMKLWFKHWNWPYPLRIKTTYRNWSIKYDDYSKGKAYLKYSELSSPLANGNNGQFGKLMLDDFIRVLDDDMPDAAFFKFCFVDFEVNAGNLDERYNQLIEIIKDAYKETEKRNILLIIGNALPMTGSNDETLSLQKKFNHWLLDFSSGQSHVAVFDMFSPLVDNMGRLKPDYERGGGDPHLNDLAFSELDKTLFKQLETLLIIKKKE